MIELAVVNLGIHFNNLRSPFLKRKLFKLFFDALSDRLSRIDMEGEYFFEVSIKFTSEKEIKKLNKGFRNVDKVTDVLSFPTINFYDEKIKCGYNMLGDVAICKKIAKEQARKYGHSLYREVCFLALHGFLHLLGYDHIEKIDEEEMTGKAKKILDKNKVKR